MVAILLTQKEIERERVGDRVLQLDVKSEVDINLTDMYESIHKLAVELKLEL